MAIPPKSKETNAVGAAIVSATRRLLIPLIKLLISRGVTLPALHILLKSVYVEVTEEEFALKDRKLTDSRVSLLTGVHRKDVQKLRSDDGVRHQTPGSVSVGTRLVSTWIDDPGYLDQKGRPRKIPIKHKSASEPSFEHLVQQVSKKDLHPRVVLDELIRLEIVSVADSEVRLNIDAFVPDNSQKEKAWFFGENLASHMAAGVHNLLDEKPAMLERSVSYSGLSKEDVNALKKQANDLGMQVLKELNRQARKLKKNSAKQRDGANQRFTFGLYLHNRKDDVEKDDQSK